MQSLGLFQEGLQFQILLEMVTGAQGDWGEPRKLTLLRAAEAEPESDSRD